MAIAAAQAADLVEVQPVTDRILMLHISDGHMDYWNPAVEGIAANHAYHGPLDTAAAEAAGSYRLSSADDAAYASARAPGTVGRKSKGQDFASVWFPQPHVILEHWLYLEFPQAMQPGRSYQLTLADGLVENGGRRTFTFAPATMRSPTVHVSQLGFPTQAPKFVYLSQWMGSFANARHAAGGLELDDYAGAAFTVVDDASGAAVFSGVIRKRKDRTEADSGNTQVWGPSGNYTMADVYDGDFSALRTPGRYRVVVERMGTSFPFEIHDDIYRKAFRQAMRGMFLMRQGIIQEVEPGVEYPRDHYVGDPGVRMAYDPGYHYWENGNHDLAGNGFDFTSHPIEGGVWGWYHDAGDWDSYAGAHSVSAASMLLLYRMKPEAFSDGEIGNRYRLVAGGPVIDEGANGLPDLLDEARWHIDFLRRTRATLLAKGYGTGGVPGYVGVDSCSAGASWQDRRRLGVTAEDPPSTWIYAASCAVLAHDLDLAWGRSHPGQRHPESAGYVAEAVSATAWAQAWEAAHPDQSAAMSSLRFAADLGLFIATGDTERQASAKALYSTGYQERYFAVWSGLYFTMAIEAFYGCLPASTPGLDTGFWQEVRDNYANKARHELVDTAAASGFRFGIADNMWLTVGPFTTPGTSGVPAHAMNGSQAVLDALHERCAYHLGGNEMNMSHMTGIGQYREHAVFHPDAWAVFNDDGPVYTSEPFPGFSVYMRAQFDVWVGDGSENTVSQPTLFPVSTMPVAQGADGAWPYSERRIPNRNSIVGSEYTHHQNNVQNVFAYGYLCSSTVRLAQAAIVRPAVALNVAAGARISRERPFPMTCHGSADIRRVAYYYDWHYIGESSDAASGFRCLWDPSQTTIADGPHRLTVVAWNQDGERCARTSAVEAEVEVVAGSGEATSALAITGLSSTRLAVNRSYRLGWTVVPATASYTPVLWSSSDPAVATVDPDGLLRAVGPGEATITVRTADDAASGSLLITARQVPLADLAITGAPAYLAVRARVDLDAIMTPADTSQGALLWSTSDPSLATVDGEGVVMGIGSGDVVIAVSGAGGAVQAQVVIPVRHIGLSAMAIAHLPTGGLAVGGTADLDPVFVPADASDRTVAWACSDPAIASIDAAGVVTAHRIGTCTVTVTAAGGASAQAVIAVLPIYDGFEYPAGSIAGAAGGSGWGGPWSVTAGALVAQAGSLRADGAAADLSVSGGMAFIDDPDGSAYATRPFAAARIEGHTWLSASLRYQATIGYDWAGTELFLRSGSVNKVGFGLKADADAAFYGWATGGDWGSGAWLAEKTCLTSVYPTDQTAWFALHVDHDAAVVTFYFNPTPGADEATLVPLGTYSAADDPNLNALAMSFDGVAIRRSNTSANHAWWDEIRVGDTWESVCPRAAAGSIALAASSTPATEGDSGATTAIVSVRRSGGSLGRAQVDYAVTGSGATAGSDFLTTSGTLTWEDGDLSDKQIHVTVLGDVAFEGDERISVVLSDATGAAMGAIAAGSLVIINDDAGPIPAVGHADAQASAAGGRCGAGGLLAMAGLLGGFAWRRPRRRQDG